MRKYEFFGNAKYRVPYCSTCGGDIPYNASRCPLCGSIFETIDSPYSDISFDLAIPRKRESEHGEYD